MPLQGNSECPRVPSSHVRTILGKHVIPGSTGNRTQHFLAKDRYKHWNSKSLCLQQLRTVTSSCGGCLKSDSPSLMMILSPPSPDLQFESGCGVTMPPDIAVLLKLCGKDQQVFRPLWMLLGSQDVSGGSHSTRHASIQHVLEILPALLRNTTSTSRVFSLSFSSSWVHCPNQLCFAVF